MPSAPHEGQFLRLHIHHIASDHCSLVSVQALIQKRGSSEHWPQVIRLVATCWWPRSVARPGTTSWTQQVSAVSLVPGSLRAQWGEQSYLPAASGNNVAHDALIRGGGHELHRRGFRRRLRRQTKFRSFSKTVGHVVWDINRRLRPLMNVLPCRLRLRFHTVRSRGWMNTLSPCDPSHSHHHNLTHNHNPTDG